MDNGEENVRQRGQCKYPEKGVGLTVSRKLTKNSDLSQVMEVETIMGMISESEGRGQTM